MIASKDGHIKCKKHLIFVLDDIFTDEKARPKLVASSSTYKYRALSVGKVGLRLG